MKDLEIIIPAAGIGKRLRPHTHSMPKGLIHVAGKPILGHILDEVESLNPARVILVVGHKAEMLEDGAGLVHTANRTFPIPSVIRLPYLVKRPFRVERKLSRIEVFNRDNYTCQYCGKQTRQLTLDHIIPRYRGGQHVWKNIVSACIPCNRRKAGRTPAEAGMRLICPPSPPHDNSLFYIPRHLQTQSGWGKYLPQ